MKMDSYAQFIQEWAKKAWDLDGDFIGTMSGGIDPPKHMIDCTVVGNSTVEIRYDYPETAGLSDVRYHVTNSHRIRSDEFMFTDEGKIIMNGVPFPGVQYKDDPWTADEAKEFEKEFEAAFKDLNMRTKEDFDLAMEANRKEPEHISSILKRVVDDLRKKSDEAQEEKEIEDDIIAKKKKDAKKTDKKSVEPKGFDTANYTKSLQMVSEAETRIKFNGAKNNVGDYDGRDNNPADVMAGWDDYNETIHDRAQQERNLQSLVDEKGYHTPELSNEQIEEEINDASAELRV